MSEKGRQKINVQKPTDVNDLHQVTEEDLLSDFEKYDAENYDPLEDIDNKEVIAPSNKSEVVTVRLSPQENNMISKLAKENGLSKSSFIRMVVKRSLKHSND
ncbi:plasmid mobilization protein [Salicibibacter kimchii]|uniref:Uncharacterized protein n=1 Tax=Salicibibacter kimchii TaxID=2099786 RepID=A0A345BXR7_9BACI|nr:hypothetical protein [Salicibibacter kimchii]AXF55748.1 hypothetical protein DT065_06730 [Salicibibacter kimchii]